MNETQTLKTRILYYETNDTQKSSQRVKGLINEVKFFLIFEIIMTYENNYKSRYNRGMA